MARSKNNLVEQVLPFGTLFVTYVWCRRGRIRTGLPRKLNNLAPPHEPYTVCLHWGRDLRRPGNSENIAPMSPPAEHR